MSHINIRITAPVTRLCSTDVLHNVLHQAPRMLCPPVPGHQDTNVRRLGTNQAGSIIIKYLMVRVSVSSQRFQHMVIGRLTALLDTAAHTEDKLYQVKMMQFK